MLCAVFRLFGVWFYGSGLQVMQSGTFELAACHSFEKWNSSNCLWACCYSFRSRKMFPGRVRYFMSRIAAGGSAPLVLLGLSLRNMWRLGDPDEGSS